MGNRHLTYFSLLVMASCASSPASQYRLDEILVVNFSRQPLRDVSIRSGGRVFGCGNVAPRGVCSNRFSPRAYQETPIEISWAVGNDEPRTQTLTVAVPSELSTAQPLRGVLEIDAAGRISAYLSQRGAER